MSPDFHVNGVAGFLTQNKEEEKNGAAVVFGPTKKSKRRCCSFFWTQKRVKDGAAVVQRQDGEEDTGFGLFSESLNGPGPPKYHSTPKGHSCCSGRNG